MNTKTFSGSHWILLQKTTSEANLLFLCDGAGNRYAAKLKDGPAIESEDEILFVRDCGGWPVLFSDKFIAQMIEITPEILLCGSLAPTFFCRK